jgi:glutamate synthase domain-containing protein 3
VQKQDHGLELALDNKLIELAEPALERGEKVSAELPIINVNRTVGTTLSGEIAKKYGHAGLPDDTITLQIHRIGRPELRLLPARGVTLLLEGDANDYVGKGLSGGRIIVYPAQKATFKAEENIIAGNVIAYGAIAGEIYLRGVVGERFCVRNSGAERRRRRRRRSRLRIHDRRPRRRHRPDRPQLRRRHVRRNRLRLRRPPAVQGPVQPGNGRAGTPDKPEDIATIRRLLENHHNSPAARRQGDSGRLGKELRWFVKVMPNDYRRVLEHRPRSRSGQANDGILPNDG